MLIEVARHLKEESVLNALKCFTQAEMEYAQKSTQTVDYGKKMEYVMNATEDIFLKGESVSSIILEIPKQFFSYTATKLTGLTVRCLN